MNHLIYKISQAARKLGFDFHENQNPKVLSMQKEIKSLGSIQFKIEGHADGTWTAESSNIDGIITGGDDIKDINETIKDAVFTYFEIPPYLCNDSLLKGENEAFQVEKKVYA